MLNEKEGERRKKEGMERSSLPMDRQVWLKALQKVAYRMGKKRETITVDDVVEAVHKSKGIDVTKIMGTSLGKVFVGPKWQADGWVPSSRSSRNRGPIRSWKLVE